MTFAAPKPLSVPTSQGRTPMHHAAEWGKPLVARALLEAGADKEAKDVSGRWKGIISDRVLCGVQCRL